MRDKKGVRVNTFLLAALKKVTRLQIFQYWTLTGLRVPTALSYRK